MALLRLPAARLLLGLVFPTVPAGLRLRKLLRANPLVRRCLSTDTKAGNRGQCGYSRKWWQSLGKLVQTLSSAQPPPPKARPPCQWCEVVKADS
ncbi:Hypothetical predicted protein [Marmota monax]|uniref:Secreted protein n=1 Tax=Marmota monax TaxID=9995 RepID=A0A5E4AGP0_MARMO|nr:Hypothetical predicted protein [Marmota monax]